MPSITGREAANQAAETLRHAHSLLTDDATELDCERAQALTWVADSWTRLAETLDEHPRLDIG